MKFEKLRKYYHWLVAAVALLVYFVAIGIANNRVGHFLLPVTEGLHISRSAYSVSTSIAFAAAFCGNFMFGILYKRFGYRALVPAALLVTAGCYCWFSRAQNVWPLYLGSALMGVAEAYFSNAGTSRIVTGWFQKRRGAVLGVVMASSGVGGAVFSGVIASMIEKNGWRYAYVACALFCVALILPVVLIVRTKPSDMGLTAYGAGEKMEQKSPRRTVDWDGISVSKAVKGGCFWLAMLATLIFGLVSYGSYPFFVAHLQDQGMSLSVATVAQSVMFACMAVGKILNGIVADRICVKWIYAGCIACGMVGLALLAEVTGQAQAMIGMTLFSIGLGAPSVLIPILAMDLFGRWEYDALVGMFFSMHSLSGMIAGPVTNLFYDRYGTYSGVFYGLIGVYVLAGILYLMAFRLRPSHTKA